MKRKIVSALNIVTCALLLIGCEPIISDTNTSVSSNDSKILNDYTMKRNVESIKSEFECRYVLDSYTDVCVWVDPETGVNYLLHDGITERLNTDGTVFVTEQN